MLLLLPLLLLTGCGTEHISDRIYTQTLGISADETITLHAQAFGGEEAFSGSGASAAEAVRQCEAARGGRILIGHTELLCMDGTADIPQIQDLLFSQGLSPACKVLYTDVAGCFEEHDPAALRESIRMAERRGMLPVTELSGVLDEWLGASETALIPAYSGGSLRMALLKTDGTCTILSADAAQGMYWLRRHDGTDLTLTVSTAGGTADIAIVRSSLQKYVRGTTLFYDLTVFTDDCPEALRAALRETILSHCRCAMEEMQAAGADVIGIEALAAFGQISPEDCTAEILVTVRG